MTRKEYEFNYNKLQLTGKDAISRLYITSLEARIAELEALQASTNCSGCRYHNILLKFKPCDMCCNSHDNLYEPKD
jgi:hypothetical protein